jgi:excinuclease UvrABC nuclease subunit
MSGPEPSWPQDLPEALPESHSWNDRPTPDDLAPLPNTPAVYLLHDVNNQPVLLATTQALRRLLRARLVDPPPDQPGKTDLAAVVRGVRWRALSTAFEGRWWYYRLARELHPRDYRKLANLGRVHFLAMDLDAAIPELRLTDRPWDAPGGVAGPWSTRKACQQALDGLRDLFDLCRYPEQVRKAPEGERCAYAEMGRCDAPCDGSAPLAGYRTRSHAAWHFVTRERATWIADAQQRMKAAANEMAFERASVIKNQIAFAQRWEKEWAAHVVCAEALRYLALLPITRRKAWKLMRFERGHIVDGPIIQERHLLARAPAWLQESLQQAPTATDAMIRTEQTWLFARVLLGEQRDATTCIRLPDNAAPVDLEDRLRDAIARRAQPRSSEAGDSSAADEECA